MSTSILCPTCKHPLQTGQMVCPSCGATILSEPSATLNLPDLPDLLPKTLPVDLHVPSLPDFSLMPFGSASLTGLDQLATSELLNSARLGKGSAYRPLWGIGQGETATFQLGLPFGVAELKDGSLYVIDYADVGGAARVIHFSADGALVGMVRDFANADPAEGLDSPASIAVDTQDNFYVADMNKSWIRKYSPEGTLLATFGSEGVSHQQLTTPQDIDLDIDGNMLVADSGGNRILKWTQDGKCELVLGIDKLDDEMGWLMAGDEPGQFDEPKGVTTDQDGRILVADTNNHRVQQFDRAGELITTFGKQGQEPGELYYPDGIRVDASGSLYVSDANSGRIQKFDAAGNYIQQILLPEDAGAISDFAVDKDGHLIVALRHSHVVLKLEVL